VTILKKTKKQGESDEVKIARLNQATKRFNIFKEIFKIGCFAGIVIYGIYSFSNSINSGEGNFIVKILTNERFYSILLLISNVIFGNWALKERKQRIRMTQIKSNYQKEEEKDDPYPTSSDLNRYEEGVEDDD